MKKGHSVRFYKIRKFSVPRGFMKWIPKGCEVSNCKEKCSGRLTWVRLCAQTCPSARGTLLLAICEYQQRSGQMGSLAAVCTPTLKSASKKYQNSTPPYRSTVDGALKVVKGTVCCVYFLVLENNPSLVPCA